ncbi:hypothetical protein K461DRAFT_297035 [Myriangium duriaei CBS 260.36]|uniref:Rhodopsin domain-containing protein n=1 Tax=Myriangium duriaei CBS 260.36 TaxID=1168546 RepID=A0A9P4MD70_9PEZI|nr:hypothetical protein K461DRAFT_297035 [Myriangium duriaei CBS 260.36]
MALWSNAPPEPRSKLANHPTLLFSWWCTSFAAVLIIIRVCGRKIRTNCFFSEDLVMAASMIPLFIRMVLIHIVLTHGTNNVVNTGLTETQILNREEGSKFVLAARIFYAMFIWMSKFTVSEFLKRTFYNTWRRSYERILHAIRIFLFLTFLAVVIATLGECHPFDHYWQVVPDPGPRCRQGFAQLITMGACDIITDILLIAFPIPIIIRSHVSLGRKSVLILLFSASLLLIGITGTKVPKVIETGGRQQYRTVWASIEILLSAFVSNAIILGSFARGKGVKKNKYRAQSVSDSIERAPTRRTLPQSISRDSDENLFRSIGCRIPKELVEEVEDYPVPAKPVAFEVDLEKGDDDEHYDQDRRDSRWERTSTPSMQSRSPTRGPRDSTRDLAAFLRSTSPRSPPAHAASLREIPELHISDVGGLLGDVPGAPGSAINTHDFAQQPTSRPQRSLLSDLRTSLTVGLSPSRSSSRQREPRQTSRSRPRSVPRSTPQQPEQFDSDSATPVNNATTSQSGSIELKDVGGLLS